jgi:hypothetical protein
MFTRVDRVALLRGVLDLRAAADKYQELPQLRIGVASGMAVRRAGDWFGGPVNVPAGDGGGTAWRGAGCRIRARCNRFRCQLHLVVRGCAAPQGSQGRGEAVPRPRGEW